MQISWKTQFKSLGAAWRGLKFITKSEANFRIQLLIGALAFVLAFYFNLRPWEKILIILMITAVLVMEILNTTVEYLSDLLKPRLHHYVQVVKDIMAGAVLLTALAALVVGLIIFLPHFIQLVR